MLLLRAFKSENHFWKYLVGSILIIIASTVGQLPLMGIVMAKLLAEGKGFYNLDEISLMTVLDKNLTLFLILFSFLVALGAIYLVLNFLHKQTLLDIITIRKKVDWKRVFFAFSIWGIFQIIVTIISYYVAPEDFVLNFKPVQFAILAVIAILMIPIQTSVEELVFRGYLMQGFGLLAKNRWFPLLMTSLIFGLMHLANPEVEKMGYITMVYYIGTGLFLGILALMDDGLELSLGFHAANNLFTALLVTSDWTAFQTYSILKDVSQPEAGFEIVFPVLVIFPILLFVFAKKYGWTNWKQKLTGKLIATPEVINVEND
ncbi:CPBP family intramembrane glutamic endopeptidase [Flavobacterium sp.]|uniref:CPBP family intramembrane glutamic endopeptidase n=1 Tax=Flavobacterium sp. TaxID=239 RepID=UPI003752E2F3